jgi:hypothetical protein
MGSNLEHRLQAMQSAFLPSWQLLNTLRNALPGVYARAGAVRRFDFGCTDRTAGDLLLHQANKGMPSLPGPEKPAVGGENRTIVFQGKREIHAIP